jgi:hypothetical protein
MLTITSPSVIAVNSGFLDDYTILKPELIRDRPGAMRYMKDGVSLANYDKVAIAPVEILYSPDSKYQGISPDDMKLLADSVRELLVKELEPDYPVVGSGGKGVLEVRLAISNVKMKKKKRRLLNYTPIGFGLYTLKDIAGANIILDDATIEGQLYDSTGEQIGILVDSQKATVKKGEPSWKKLEEALTFYAKRFRQRLDSEHGK